jgi:hypothetical protein
LATKAHRFSDLTAEWSLLHSAFSLRTLLPEFVSKCLTLIVSDAVGRTRPIQKAQQNRARRHGTLLVNGVIDNSRAGGHSQNEADGATQNQVIP